MKGFGVAQRLGREGAKIAIVDANPIPENENALRAQNIEAFSIKCDVTDQQQVRDAVNKIIEVHLHVLRLQSVSNNKIAALSKSRCISASSWHHWQNKPQNPRSRAG